MSAQGQNPSAAGAAGLCSSPGGAPQSAPRGGPRQISASLSAGRLDISVRREELPFEDLLIVGERLNPKRPFIFVSKVLGKHWPVSPSVMAITHERLAALLGPLDPPVLFIAMAETAVGLGRGVFESWWRQFGLDSVFAQTTRYALNQRLAMRLAEPHSHAPEHLVYLPEGLLALLRFREARTLVMVDDEISTGRTLTNLAKAARACCPKLASAAAAALASWMPDKAPAAFIGETGLPLKVASLIEGSISFTQKRSPQAPPAVKSVGEGRLMDAVLAKNFGRLGLTPKESLRLSEEAAARADSLALPEGAPVRVIGTGEFLHEPFALARRLQAMGHRAVFQSTTRTPMAPGPAAKSVLSFDDNYGEGLDNFIYNASPGFPGPTIIAAETDPDSLRDLSSALGAQAVRL